MSKQDNLQGIAEQNALTGDRSVKISPGNIVRFLARPSSRLSHRVMHAGFWVFTSRMAVRGLTAARTIVLARLLAPADFGLFGIAMLAIALVETFSETGFKAALVQRRGNIRPYLDTAWTLHVLRGTILAALLVLAAPLVASFFDAPQAVMLIRVIAVTIFIRGFDNIGIIHFQKELEFQKQFAYGMAQKLAGVGVGIALAFALQSVWALAYGLLAESLVGLVSSYILHPYRPRPSFDIAKARDLFGFGVWILGAGVLDYFMRHINDLVVGKVLDVTALGFYRLASNLSQMTAKELTGVVGRVAFPAYSKLQTNLDKVRMAFLETVQYASLVSSPMAIGAIVLAEDLVHVVLGEKWLPIVATLQLLLIWGLIRSVSAARAPLFRALGRPNVAMHLVSAKLVLLAMLIYPLTVHWGTEGAAAALVISHGVVFPFGLRLVTSVVQCSILSYLRVVALPVACSVIMAAVLFTAKASLVSEPTLLSSIWLVALGAITYVASIVILDLLTGYGLIRTLRHRLALG